MGELTTEGPEDHRKKLAVVSADRGGGAARDAQSYEEDNEEDGGGSGGGVGEEVKENVIEAHGGEYGPGGGGERDYGEEWTKVREGHRDS